MSISEGLPPHASPSPAARGRQKATRQEADDVLASRDAHLAEGHDGTVFVLRTNHGALTTAKQDEHADEWGFADTAFRLDADGAVVLSGARYGLCGAKLTALLPWVERTMNIAVPRQPTVTRRALPPLPASRLNPGFVEAITDLLGNQHVATDNAARLRHGHGHTQEEMYGIKYGTVPRVPDIVIFPDSERDVQAIVSLAKAHNVCLVPFGGGTNVTEALRCPNDEPRTVVCVNMRRLDRILWIDEANGLARIEAGVVGRHLVSALKERGYTMGHEPDSIEFSTLGGWIATHASGMKKNKYGNIEDLVLDMTVVTSEGTTHSSHIGPRQSVGIDVERCMFGSEGTLGIVTSAIVKITPLPEVTRYGSLLFPDFEQGVQFMYALTRARLQPASVRLVDNTQFQLSLALKEEKRGLARVKSKAEKLYVLGIKGFSPDRMCACTLVYEGNAKEVARQQKGVEQLASQFQGMAAGSENGERGYQLTYSIAYIRDFVLKHGILAESFETSLPWTHIVDMCARVKARIEREHKARDLPGRPLVTSRVTQVYDTGAAVYFYFAMSIDGVNDPSATYAAIERAAREEVLAAGGSLSHHHGVGKLRQPFLTSVMSAPALQMRRAVKQALDPRNVFGVANGPVPS